MKNQNTTGLNWIGKLGLQRRTSVPTPIVNENGMLEGSERTKERCGVVINDPVHTAVIQRSRV